MPKRFVLLALLLVGSVVFLAPGLAARSAGQAPSISDAKWEGYSAAREAGKKHGDSSSGAARCVDGMAAGMYPCDDVDLLSHVPLQELGLTFANDMWGWTDRGKTKKKWRGKRGGKTDYAIIGGTEGTVFVDISKPTRPDVVGILPAHIIDPARPFWRDIKVYKHYVFVVSEQLGHGLQVFDLKELRKAKGDFTVFTETAHYAGFSTSHNLNINEDTGFLYAVGARNLDRSLSCEGGLHMVDINDPTNPTFAGCFGDNGYVHDTQCVIYKGPDADHRGSEICFNSNAAGDYGAPDHFVNIVDVTDKANPVSLAREPYPLPSFSHQGWLTPNQKFFLHGDEGDEVIHGLGTTTRIWDVTDLDNPELIGVHDNGTPSIDHNIYTEGKVAYASNYTSGLRVYSTRKVSRGTLSEIAFFDVYPENDDASFEGGSWSNYGWFHQKDVVGVSSMDRGLFVLELDLDDDDDDDDKEDDDD